MMMMSDETSPKLHVKRFLFIFLHMVMFLGTNPVSPVPITANPVTTPSTPVTNPTPSMAPPTMSSGGGRWCIANVRASQAPLQSALDYACGIGGADCAMIQQGGSCYDPVTLQNHASYAFNSYYQKNPVPTSCDFGGTAVLTTTNPSSGSCVFPSSSSPSSSTMPTSSSSPPPGFSWDDPDLTGLGAFGASPPMMLDTSSVSKNLRPFIGSFVLVCALSLTLNKSLI